VYKIKELKKRPRSTWAAEPWMDGWMGVDRRIIIKYTRDK
jgi:hypothetical protein